jgi:hypothetical protein
MELNRPVERAVKDLKVRLHVDIQATCPSRRLIEGERITKWTRKYSMTADS